MMLFKTAHFDDFMENCHLKEWGFLGKQLSRAIINHIDRDVFLKYSSDLACGDYQKTNVLFDVDRNTHFFSLNYELIRNWFLRLTESSDFAEHTLAPLTYQKYGFNVSVSDIKAVWLCNDHHHPQYSRMADIAVKILATQAAYSFTVFVDFQNPLPF